MVLLFPSIRHLSERQQQLFFLFHTAIARHKPEGFGRLVDEDVAQAAAAVASTLETAARGVIYEHTPQSIPAQRLATELTALLGEIRTQGGTVHDGEAAIVLRAIERGAADAAKVAGGDKNAYLALMARLLQVRRPVQQSGLEEPARSQSALILP